MSKYEAIYAWMRKESRNKLDEVSVSFTNRFRGKLGPQEYKDLYSLFREAFMEGYADGRADEDTDGYYYAMYQAMMEAGGE